VVSESLPLGILMPEFVEFYRDTGFGCCLICMGQTTRVAVRAEALQVMCRYSHPKCQLIPWWNLPNMKAIVVPI